MNSKESNHFSEQDNLSDNNENSPITEDNKNIITPVSSESGILELPTNLDGLSYEDAKEYVISIMTMKKQYEKDTNKINAEIDALKKKTPLDSNKISSLEEKLKKLEIEELELTVKLDLLKESLIKNKSHFEPSINAHALLEGIEQILGKSTSDIQLEKEISEVHIKDKLEKLKRKMDTNQ
ncbi:MAG: hypothetical protein OEV44_09420 [Spirochaetota bacterium]|nr:hypothetical protein [Spirochaetota bacterium]